MFILTKPTRSAIDDFLARVSFEEFSYSDIGATQYLTPKGYTVDHNRLMIGQGPDAWERARRAVRNWKMFDLSWVELFWPNTALEVGRDVAVLVSHLGFYSINGARIVYTIDEPNRFGFAYGTLESHVESGEERFSVDFDAGTGEVWYDLLAFSRPNLTLARVGYPYTRWLQKHFAVDSMAAMLRAVAEP